MGGEQARDGLETMDERPRSNANTRKCIVICTCNGHSRRDFHCSSEPAQPARDIRVGGNQLFVLSHPGERDHPVAAERRRRSYGADARFMVNAESVTNLAMSFGMA